MALCSAFSSLFTLLVEIPLSAFSGTNPSVGSIAPDFTLQAQDGKRTSLRDFLGKWVVLYFYPKDFTSGCTIEAHNFQRDLPLYRRKNAVVLGVSLDGIDSHKDFCTQEGLNFKLLSDVDGDVSRAYGVLANFGIVQFDARSTFLIDPDGKIAKVFSNVDAYHHSEEVLETLIQLARTKPQPRRMRRNTIAKTAAR